MKIPVIYSPKQVSDSGSIISPSGHKPAEMVKHLQARPNSKFEIEFLEPVPLDARDFIRAHKESYVRDILTLRIPNGFGTISKSVCDSLPYTNGAMYTAAKAATPDAPACALVSGFHHAGWDNCSERLGLFCTFNGLVISALKLIEEDGLKKVSIIDADMHWGNGTDEILGKLSESRRQAIHHFTFGKHFTKPIHADRYLPAFNVVEQELSLFKPDLVLYQSGADTHKNDPSGGILTTSQMFQRDYRMFSIAKKLRIPLAWDLAGGYQKGPDGNIDKVLRLHYNTFRACAMVHG